MPTSINYKQNINNPKIQPGQKIQRVLVNEQYVIKQQDSELYYGLDRDREFVEMHFYIPDTETLVYSATIPLAEPYLVVTNNDTNKDDGVLQLQLFIWSEPSSEYNQIRDDDLQTKYLEGLPSGYYDVIINFFADEIGTYNDIDWRIKTISPSKREIVLHANPQQDGSGVVNFSDTVRRDYEQFLYTSIFYNEFVDLLQLYFADSDTLYNDTISELNQKQPTALDKAQTYIPDFPQYILELLQHTGFDIGDWVNNEKSSDNPGGARWRIQQDRFKEVLDVITSSIAQEHLRTINTNDSGPVPFIIDE
jgi:hypothetical protein